MPRNHTELRLQLSCVEAHSVVPARTERGQRLHDVRRAQSIERTREACIAGEIVLVRQGRDAVGGNRSHLRRCGQPHATGRAFNPRDLVHHLRHVRRHGSAELQTFAHLMQLHTFECRQHFSGVVQQRDGGVGHASLHGTRHVAIERDMGPETVGQRAEHRHAFDVRQQKRHRDRPLRCAECGTEHVETGVEHSRMHAVTRCVNVRRSRDTCQCAVWSVPQFRNAAEPRAELELHCGHPAVQRRDVHGSGVRRLQRGQ